MRDPVSGRPRDDSPMRVVLLGNAGAGKTTMARQLIGDQDIAHLSLDEIAWGEATERRPLADRLRALERFLDAHEQWVIAAACWTPVDQRN